MIKYFQTSRSGGTMRYQYRFLLLDTDRNLTLLFGYRLALSPAETALVKALLTEGSAGVHTVAGIPDRSLPVHVPFFIWVL